jgi:hypothetical protein
LRQAGVEPIVIGSGGPSFARGFKERMGIDFSVYSDRALTSYAAAGFRRSYWRLLHPMVLVRGVVAIFRHRQRRTQGDAAQLGGVLLVDRGGTVAYRFVSAYAGDHPRVETLLEAARRRR